MPEPQTTITIRPATKARLLPLKGERSWDELLNEMVEHYPLDRAIEEAERRLAELRAGKAKTVKWAEVKARRGRQPRK
ncbi:MAG TPA: addiction module protein [Candidatus Thermoplasmatota archaeon]|nr:addiction module protein [Candidatus Thermoplasmatota archaeon]